MQGHVEQRTSQRVWWEAGITAASGISAELGIPLTHRGLATSVRFLTGHARESGEAALDATVAASADPATTLVIYMVRRMRFGALQEASFGRKSVQTFMCCLTLAGFGYAAQPGCAALRRRAAVQHACRGRRAGHHAAAAHRVRMLGGPAAAGCGCRAALAHADCYWGGGCAGA